MNLTDLEPKLPKSSVFIWLMCIDLLILLLWALLFKLEEVSRGTGKFIPSSKAQIVQPLEGRILTQLHVHGLYMVLSKKLM